MPETTNPTNSTCARAMGFAARIAFAGLMVLTSFYGVLAYLPDTYIAFIQAPFQSWIPLLIRNHAVVFAAVGALLAAVLWRESTADQRGRRLVMEFIVAAVLVCAYSFATRLFAGLRNDSRSFIWALAVLFPILWMGIIDWRLYWRKRDWRAATNGNARLRELLVVAAAIGLIYPGTAYLRYVLNGYSQPFHASMLLAWGGAVVAHVLFFAVLFGLVRLAETLAGRTSRPQQTRFILLFGIAWLGVAVVMERIAFAAIPYSGTTESLVYSVWFGLALAMFGSGLALRASVLRQTRQRAVGRKRAEIALFAVVLVIAAYVVPAFIGVIDWNSILERTWVLVFWTATLVALFRFAPRTSRPIAVLPALLVPVLAYGLYAVNFGSRRWSSPESSLHPVIERHAYFDVSYATLRELMSHTNDLPCDELCDYVHEQSNIPPWMPGPAPEVNLVDDLRPGTGALPNIFVIVVDSLAQDFLSPYNPAEATPEIAAFARESVVFQNAFTRYAGTTLSEPSIWAGAMLLHTHYSQPFSNVNNLEKLVRTDGYEAYITVDTTIRGLLTDIPGAIRLDEAAGKWTQVDFCGTTDEFATRVLQRKDSAKPIFMFTQPQNMHLITVQKRHTELLVHTKEALKKVYRQDLRQFDSCFGKFVRLLKTRNLYDHSIIVLTADHGEFGHDSHATSVEPEIMRVPLIVHVPEKNRTKYHYDPKAIAFTTDITPTLYYLLGHRPIRNDDLLGRPLFTETSEEARRYQRETYLLASSYAPNYGILRDNGRLLFTVDDRKRSYALYDIISDPMGDKNLLRGVPTEADKQSLRKHLQHVAATYKFQYKRPSLLRWMLQ